MRRLILFLGCILPLGACEAAVADQDPPHKHYVTSRIPLDPAFKDARSVGRYRGFLRQSVDLTRLMPPVRDQGEVGSGIAWAVAYAARSYYAGRNEGRDIESPENEASPNYVFDLARRGDCDEGVTITDTVEVLRKGALSLAAYPYKSVCQQPPTSAQRDSATDFRVKGYRVLDAKQVDDVKGQLERGNPVVALFRDSPTFQEFRGKGTFEEADFAAPAGDDAWQPLTIIGYDDAKQAVRVMNSWGRGWGDAGYAWVSYKALANRTKGAIVLEVAAAISQPPVQRPPEPTEPPVQPPELPQPRPKDNASVEPPHQQVQEQPTEDAHKTEEKQAENTGPQEAPPKPKIKPTMADLRGLSCGKITEDPANGRTMLNGYVASDEDFAKVKEVAEDTPNVSVGKVTVAPWPLCEALGTLEKPLKADIRPVLRTNPVQVAKAGETLRVELDAPSKPTYVYLSYFTADEKVITLVQPQGAILPQTPARDRQVFGDGSNGRPKFTVGAPFGSEMLVAITSASPLFDSTLPEVQSEREFLSTLRKALVYKPVASLPDRQVGAAIQVLKTEPN